MGRGELGDAEDRVMRGESMSIFSTTILLLFVGGLSIVFLLC